MDWKDIRPHHVNRVMDDDNKDPLQNDRAKSLRRVVAHSDVGAVMEPAEGKYFAAGLNLGLRLAELKKGQ